MDEQSKQLETNPTVLPKKDTTSNNIIFVLLLLLCSGFFIQSQPWIYPGALWTVIPLCIFVLGYVGLFLYFREIVSLEKGKSKTVLKTKIGVGLFVFANVFVWGSFLIGYLLAFLFSSESIGLAIAYSLLPLSVLLPILSIFNIIYIFLYMKNNTLSGWRTFFTILVLVISFFLVISPFSIFIR
jgi:hypothetical protein